ncbi:MAG TPA: glutamate--cysteine ligase [Bdellovibrionales bacterium]|nr:MAG: glutamate--cysteine ligase [Bdellovibrionales bacterium GWB1_52_6]OFZ03629.1 MAG: glutamate--cysteine ligase [Bdellovibrionales bacterium GWA1_52_35]OFZ41636.1 MAG: glutamate--cysteine ligase [Bdellovibrionales bacterium GWC1_52_8]HAR43803.1 glutamate--cysteine ligase [Bdellovibrionales bacterium]HCM40647.1 glutamate--cysteine ligase [Bdellovibrionales bacterium]
MKSIKPFLAKKILTHLQEIQEWNARQLTTAPPPFYCSVDLRDSGYKIVPVDCNIYPAGFNNICPQDVRTASSVFRVHLDRLFPAGRRPSRILVLPESHTQNRHYIENLYHLSEIIREAGLECRIGWFGTEPQESPVQLISESNKLLKAYPIRVTEGVLSAGEFTPDLILLNNDFSGGYPALLDKVRQPIVPSHVLGWHTRKKGEHFHHYNALATEFARIIDVDPWLFQILTQEVDHVDFNENEGLDRVIDSAERVLSATRKAFETHEINRKPFVFVKNSSGTYGMGIMVIHSVDELKTMNRRTRNKMSVGKNKHPIHSVVIQEGVPTATLVNRLPAEPVIYLFGDELVGGFLRTHTQRGVEENLNTPGMVFRKLCMSDLRHPQAFEGAFSEESQDKDPILELVYGTVARISAFAAGRELVRLQELAKQHQNSGGPVQ